MQDKTWTRYKAVRRQMQEVCEMYSLIKHNYDILEQEVSELHAYLGIQKWGHTVRLYNGISYVNMKDVWQGRATPDLEVEDLQDYWSQQRVKAQIVMINC